MDAMNWMDDKLKEHDQRNLKPGGSNAEAMRQHKRESARATETWRQLIALVRSDLAKFKAKFPERRISVSATQDFITLDWNNPPQEALLVSRKPNGTTASYEARQKPNKLRAHKGTVDLLTESAESLSEKLLGPVLFDLRTVLR